VFRLGFEPTIPVFDWPSQILTMLIIFRMLSASNEYSTFNITCVKKRNTQFLHFLGHLSRLWFNVEKFHRMFDVQVV